MSGSYFDLFCLPRRSTDCFKGTWHFLGLIKTLFAFQAGQFPLRACTCISGLSFGSCLDGRKCFVICPFDSCVIFAFECPL